MWTRELKLSFFIFNLPCFVLFTLYPTGTQGFILFWIVLRYVWPTKGVKPYLQLRTLSKILTIANLRLAVKNLRICWTKLSAAIRKWTHSHEVYFFPKSPSLPSTSSTSSIENNSRKIIPNPLIATETKKYWWLHFQKTAGLFGFYFLFFFSLISDFESCLRLMSVLNQCGKFKIICN